MNFAIPPRGNPRLEGNNNSLNNYSINEKQLVLNIVNDFTPHLGLDLNLECCRMNRTSDASFKRKHRTDKTFLEKVYGKRLSLEL